MRRTGILSGLLMPLIGMSAALAYGQETDANGSNLNPTASTTEVKRPSEVTPQETNPAAAELVSPKELAELKERVQELEKNQSAEAAQKDAFKPSLRVYGFMDLTFGDVIAKKNSGLYLTMPKNSTFTQTNINTYFYSRLSEDFSALLELRFTYAPNGTEDDYTTAMTMNGNQVVYKSSYQRQDTTQKDTFDAGTYQLGGVAIERAHMTYKLADWFQIMLGRYLTPFGLFNVEHGAPARLPITSPYFITYQMIPLAQTGIQAFGRTFPMDHVTLDYAVTFSNGRGPADAVVDYNADKAFGGRLRLAYESNDLAIAVGGYGYIGKYTDIEKTLVLDRSALVINSNISKVAEYEERDLSTDLSVQFRGLVLQAEYIYKIVKYSVPAHMSDVDLSLRGHDPNELVQSFYYPSHKGYGYSVLLGYELPRVAMLRSASIVPYVYYTKGQDDDTTPYNTLDSYSAGLTVKPMPFWVLKAQGTYAKPAKASLGTKNYELVLLQSAVAF